MTAPIALELSEDRKKFLHTLFTTAIEGGVNYWALVTKYRWSIRVPGEERPTDDINGFVAVLLPCEGGWGIWEDDRDTAPLTVDLEVMRLGVDRFCRYVRGEIDSRGRTPAENPNFNSRDLRGTDHYWVRFLVQDATNGEQGDSDAEVADQILQWGLFNAGVYG
jgi:hypothetical protein